MQELYSYLAGRPMLYYVFMFVGLVIFVVGLVAVARSVTFVMRTSKGIWEKKIGMIPIIVGIILLMSVQLYLKPKTLDRLEGVYQIVVNVDTQTLEVTRIERIFALKDKVVFEVTRDGDAQKYYLKDQKTKKDIELTREEFKSIYDLAEKRYSKDLKV